jgi:hypothetical protein
MLSKVSVLSVPQWKALVGTHGTATAPLRDMPCLQTVLVDDAVDGPAFDLEGFNFKRISSDQIIWNTRSSHSP